ELTASFFKLSKSLSCLAKYCDLPLCHVIPTNANIDCYSLRFTPLTNSAAAILVEKSISGDSLLCSVVALQFRHLIIILIQNPFTVIEGFLLVISAV
ncbi:6135_t:CDS:1, partial [Dentiscutata heterogama]